MSVQRSTWLATLAIIMVGMLAVACGGTMTAPGSQTATPAQSAVARDALVPAVPQVPKLAYAEEARPIYTEKVNLDAFAPPGLGRDLTIMNCDNCHPWVCTLPGQRPVKVWESVRYRHRLEGLVDLPDRDWDTLFSYLEDNFSDRKPEPQLPSAYNGVWCAFDDMQ